MKLLLDEQVPRQLAALFPDEFEVRTVQQMGWAGTKNGQLLQLASEHQFVAMGSGLYFCSKNKDLTLCYSNSGGS